MQKTVWKAALASDITRTWNPTHKNHSDWKVRRIKQKSIEIKGMLDDKEVSIHITIHYKNNITKSNTRLSSYSSLGYETVCFGVFHIFKRIQQRSLWGINYSLDSKRFRRWNSCNFASAKRLLWWLIQYNIQITHVLRTFRKFVSVRPMHMQLCSIQNFLLILKRRCLNANILLIMSCYLI